MNNKNSFLLDVRDDSSWMHISSDARGNAYGNFKHAVHISLADLVSGKGNIPVDKNIVIIDLYGDDAAKAAQWLKQKNYRNVFVLLEGMDRILQDNKSQLTCMQTDYVSPVKYNIMSAQELKQVVEASDNYVFLDIRTSDEYNNKHKNSWQNAGHLANAINIPIASLATSLATIESYKEKPVIIYGFGSSTSTYEAANILTANGFNKVNVLQGGIFNVGWTAANIKGYASLAKLRVDVPVENQ
jgi:rhodanese-related sulfurtransferase